MAFVGVAKRHVGTANEIEATLWLLNQGYDVFRNVSPHGPIDLIARRDDEILYLDVKGVKSPSATEEQIKLGVKFLMVSDAGCEIIDPPSVWRECKYCDREFTTSRKDKLFCSGLCESRDAKGDPTPHLLEPLTDRIF